MKKGNYQFIKDKYASCEEVTEANQLSNYDFYVYILLVDDRPTLIGEGTGSRAKVMFEGYTLPSHIKAFPTAMECLLGSDKRRLIIPSEDKVNSRVIERDLQIHFQFKEERLDERNMKLYRDRLNQLGIKEDKNFTIAMMPLIFSTGSDAGTWKKILPFYEEIMPGFVAFANRLFGGYYKELEV